MERTVQYSNPCYCLLFGVEDTLWLDITLSITMTELHGNSKESTVRSFTCEILKAQLNSERMEFATHLVRSLDCDRLEKLTKELFAALKEDVEPQLYTLFHLA